MNVIEVYDHGQRFLTCLTIDQMMKIITEAGVRTFASPHDVYLGLLIAERSAIKAIVKFSDEHRRPFIPVGKYAEIYLAKLRNEVAV